VYVYQIIAVNYCEDMYPHSSLPFFNDTDTNITAPSYDYDYVIAPQCRGKGDTPVNRQFIAASSVHVFNGVMFGLVWVPYFIEHPELSMTFRLLLLLPEFLNICEASLYIKSATLYGEAAETCANLTCDLYTDIHRYETSAAFLEMFASFGWFWSWYVTYLPGPGRGISIWDPDFLGAVGLILPSIIYVAYNIQNILRPDEYKNNSLYEVADLLYGIDAPLYLFAALRDAGCFWWLRFIPGCADPPDRQKLLDTGSVAPAPLPLDDNNNNNQKRYGTHSREIR